MKSRSGFDRFHDEVINMPREKFSNTSLQKIKTLASYILLTEGKIPCEGYNYKQVMGIIRDELNSGNRPLIRDNETEKRYFTFSNLDAHYDGGKGRMFRHLMSLCAFFGFVKSISKNNKIFLYDKCREFILSDDDILMPVARSNIMIVNAGTNDFIKSLRGIDIDDNTDYRPTYALLRYIKEIKRPATRFELATLIGRIDKVKTESEILKRALDIGRILPKTKDEQMRYFFANMQWKEANGQFFEYKNSQQPFFKFNTYFLLLSAFDLISYNKATDTYTLTSYAEEILSDDISYFIADLERLLDIIDDYDSDNSELNDLILYQRDPELLRYAKEDSSFVTKMNKRSLKNPKYDQKGKKIRNRLIAELAKILVDYKCQYAQRHIFKMPNGKYYCEAHHIIEFSTESGPDITNNLVVLGPEAHMLIHHACKEEVDDAFYQLRLNGALDIERFKEMITVYNCLNSDQINILKNRNVITTSERDELISMLSN